MSKPKNKDTKLVYLLLGVVGVLVLAVVINVVANKTTPNQELAPGDSSPNQVMESEEIIENIREQQKTDENYAHSIGTDELYDVFSKEEGTYYVQYHSPVCQYCLTETPIISEGYKTSTTEIPLYQYDVTLSEGQEIFDLSNITGVPVLVKYENGKEVYRSEGAVGSKDYYVDLFSDGDDTYKDILTTDRKVDVKSNTAQLLETKSTKSDSHSTKKETEQAEGKN